MNNMVILLISILVLSACGGKVEQVYPKPAFEKRIEARGSILTGSDRESGITLWGGSSEGGGSVLGKKSHALSTSPVWRAAIETVSFMPILVSDSNGGVISTDWYEAEGVNGERFKINIIVTSPVLSVDAVKVAVFKQVKDRKGDWVAGEVSSKIGEELEEKILLRAREINFKS